MSITLLPNKTRILIALSAYSEPVTVTQLTRDVPALKFERSVFARAVTQLVDEGFVRAWPPPRDRRPSRVASRRLVLTEQGRDSVRHLFEHIDTLQGKSIRQGAA